MKTKPNEYDYFQTLNLNIFIPDTERINLIADVVLEKEENPLKFFSFFLRGHYNEIGYINIGQAIYDFISENEN